MKSENIIAVLALVTIVAIIYSLLKYNEERDKYYSAMLICKKINSTVFDLNNVGDLQTLREYTRSMESVGYNCEKGRLLKIQK